MKARAAQLHGFGFESDLIRLDECEVSEPDRDEVMVAMLASPVHPADLNVIEGTYGTLPDLPATLGNEGCGRVIAVGSGVRDVVVGDVVAIFKTGNWCQVRVVHALDVVVIPSDIDPILASMVIINPLTAWAMIHARGLPVPGTWIAQNAANSAVGQCVIQIAKELHLRTLNLVRRVEVMDDLTALGADLVFANEAEFATAAKRLAKKDRPMLAFNAVGGSSALTLANALADGGCLMTYGAMARQPLKVPNGMMIFRGLHFCGFWLRKWLLETSREDRATAVRQVVGWMQARHLSISVDTVFPLSQVFDAIAAAKHPSRGGKIVLDLAKDT